MYVIVGASSGVGKALAAEFAEGGFDLVLVSREERDTQAVASDLMLRFGVSIKSIELDLGLAEPDFSRILAEVDVWGDKFKGLLVPAGLVQNDDSLTLCMSGIDGIFRANCLSVCQLVHEVMRRAHADCNLSIVGFGSVASFRGRGANMIYSSAKAALRFYFESLRHACVGKSIVVQFYILGYLDTNLAFAHSLIFPKGNPVKLAKQVFRNIDMDIGVAVFPRFWLVVGLVIKMVPWSIYKRLKF